MKRRLHTGVAAFSLFATTALVAATGAVSAQSFSSTDTPRPVPPTGTAGSLTSTITVPAIGTIDDVNLSFDLTHTWGGDLLIRLTAPSGTNFVAVNNELSGSGCGSSSDFAGSYTFDDEAGAPFTFTPGTYTVGPNGSGSMADFEGEAAGGDWALFIDDQCSADSGTLNSWGLAFSVAAAPPGGGELAQFAASSSTVGRFVALNARELSRFRGRDSLATRDEVLSFTRVADPETGEVTVTRSTMDSAQMLGDVYAWADLTGFRADDEAADRAYSGRGLQIGADMAISPDMVVGLSFGVQDLDASVGAVRQDGVLRYLQPYLAYRAGAWSGEASLIHGLGDYRQVSGGGTGEGETRLTAVTFNGGYDFALPDEGVTVTPMLALVHGRERVEGVSGTLAGAGTETVRFSQVSLGAEISHATPGGEVFAGLHADWLNTDAETALVSGLLVDDGWTGRLEVGLSGEIGRGLSLDTSFALSGLGGDLRSTSGTLRFAFRF